MSNKTKTAGIKVAKGQCWNYISDILTSSERKTGPLAIVSRKQVGWEGECDHMVMATNRGLLTTLHTHQCGHVLEEGFEYKAGWMLLHGKSLEEMDGWMKVATHVGSFSTLYRRPIAQASEQGATLSEHIPGHPQAWIEPEQTPAEAHGLVVGGLYVLADVIRRIASHDTFLVTIKGEAENPYKYPIGLNYWKGWKLITRDSDEAIRILGLMVVDDPWEPTEPSELDEIRARLDKLEAGEVQS